MEKLPVYSLNKKKGNLAADYLKRVISNFAVVNIIDESVDLGIDMRAELLKETSPIGLFFNIQSKGKDEVDSETEKQGYFTVPIKISTINYWRQQNDVTILFVVDNVMGKCYWCNPLEQIADKISSIQSQDTVTIRVYLNKYIDLSSQECPSSIRQDIMLYMVNQVEHINEKLEKIKKELISGSKVNTKTSIELLKRITKTASQTVGTYSYYETLRDKINASYNATRPSFASKTKSDATTYELKWNESNQRFEYTFTDKNGVLGNFDFSIDGFSVSKSGNSMTVYTKSVNTTATLGSFKSTIGAVDTTSSCVFWLTGNSGDQEFVSEQPSADPISAYIKVKTENIGYGEITKTDKSSGVHLKGAVYGIYSDSNCKKLVDTMTTDKNGYAKSKALTAGTYYVQEITAPAGYVRSDKIHTLTVKAGKTTGISLTDVEQLGSLTIYKEGEVLVGWNGSNFTYETRKLPGATFKVSRHALTFRAYGKIMAEQRWKKTGRISGWSRRIISHSFTS